MIDGWSISCKVVLKWMPINLIDGKSTLVEVMAWCRQATSHYLSLCWPRSQLPYGVIRPQWVNDTAEPCYNMVYHDVILQEHMAMISTGNRRDYEFTKDTPCLALTAQPCSFFCEHSDRNGHLIKRFDPITTMKQSTRSVRILSVAHCESIWIRWCRQLNQASNHPWDVSSSEG